MVYSVSHYYFCCKVVSWNGGTPKSSIIMWCSLINHPAMGVSPWLWKPPYLLSLTSRDHGKKMDTDPAGRSLGTTACSLRTAIHRSIARSSEWPRRPRAARRARRNAEDAKEICQGDGGGGFGEVLVGYGGFHFLGIPQKVWFIRENGWEMDIQYPPTPAYAKAGAAPGIAVGVKLAAGFALALPWPLKTGLVTVFSQAWAQGDWFNGFQSGRLAAFKGFPAG